MSSNIPIDSILRPNLFRSSTSSSSQSSSSLCHQNGQEVLAPNGHPGRSFGENLSEFAKLLLKLLAKELKQEFLELLASVVPDLDSSDDDQDLELEDEEQSCEEASDL